MKAAPARPVEERTRRDIQRPGRRLEQGPARVGPIAVLDRSTVQRLQASAGNAAVVQLLAQRGSLNGQGGVPGAAVGLTVQRLAPGGACPAPPVAPPKTAPGADPRFRSVKADVAAKKKQVAQHPPATSESKAAQDAAVAPPDDKQAQGKAAQAEKMNAAKPGTFDKEAFIRAVYAAVAAKTPKNLDEADKFGESGKAGEIKSEVAGHVGKGKEASARDIETTTKAAPDTSQAKDKPVVPLKPDKPPPRPGAPNAANAVPPKAPAEATQLGASKCETDQQMAQAEVTEEQLRKGNEPEFDQALTAKKAGAAHDAKAPAQARAQEQKQLDAAKADATQAGQTGITQMVGDRVQAGQKVTAGKGQTKSKDEAKRAEATARLQKVFDAAKADVEKILSGLDGLVDKQFDEGERDARAAFTADHERRMKEYKDQRYSGFWGPAKWAKDKLLGMPAEANQIYQHSKKLYEQKMQGVISGIADTVGRELGKAKDRIATGRAELKAEVAKLPKDLQRFGQEAAKDFTGKFDELDKSVDEKSQQLVEHLAERYVEARNAVDQEIKKLQEANKGLWDKVKDAVVGVIQTILQLKDMLLAVLRKAASVVMAIIKDPIGFLGKLVSGVKAGLQAFIANIGEHLKKGLVGWLLGNLSSAGIELPGRFDVKGIIQLVASLLGLTWASIRGRVVQRGVPEQAMSAVERSVPEAQVLQREGVPGLWQHIVAKIGDIKEMILGKIKDFLVPTVLIAGITWIVSLLNPASAFIKAVKAIIDIVQFIFERGAQLVEFVNSVLDAIIAIAGGAVGGAAKLVETALAKSIPVLIGFLAALLGIGGLANKVKSFFQALSKPVMKAVDTVVGFIVKAGKKLWAKLKGKVGSMRRRVAGRFRGARDKFGAWRNRRRAAAERRRDERDQRRRIDPAERRRREEQSKQARLDRALAALRPKVDALFNRGVTGLALKSQLFAWRLQYRLSSLSAVRNGESVEIWATVNPRGLAGRGIEPDHVELRSNVNQVVRELLSDRDIRRRYLAMRRRLADQAGMPLPEGTAFAAGAAALRREGRRMRPWAEQTHTVGQVPDPVSVREFKMPGKTNAIVREINSYPEIAGQLASSGLRDRQVARELRSLITTGRVSEAVTGDQRELLGKLSYLMVAREGARNPRNLAHVGMTLDLVEHGKWTWQHAFAGYEGQMPGERGRPVPIITGERGAFPMSMKGAAAAARGLAAEDQQLPMSSGGSEAERRELEAREYDIIEEWMMLKLRTKRNLLAHSPNTIREHIRRLLLDFFKGR